MRIETLTGNALTENAFEVPGPVALDFYQSTCPPCRALEPRLDRVAEQYAGRLPVYRVDIDRDLPVAENFQVRSLPTVLILRNGKEIYRLDGLILEQDLEAAFENALGPDSVP